MMPTAADIVWLAVMVVSMGCVVGFAFWHFRRVRDGRMDPLVGPEWSRPPSPSIGIRWNESDHHDEMDDDHVGRPFPQPGDDGAR
jgi:hypothetical protein